MWGQILVHLITWFISSMLRTPFVIGQKGNRRKRGKRTGPEVIYNHRQLTRSFYTKMVLSQNLIIHTRSISYGAILLGLWKHCVQLNLLNLWSFCLSKDLRQGYYAIIVLKRISGLIIWNALIKMNSVSGFWLSSVRLHKLLRHFPVVRYFSVRRLNI